jgi:hypothetical protein
MLFHEYYIWLCSGNTFSNIKLDTYGQHSLFTHLHILIFYFTLQNVMHFCKTMARRQIEIIEREMNFADENVCIFTDKQLLIFN